MKCYINYYSNLINKYIYNINIIRIKYILIYPTANRLGFVFILDLMSGIQS